MARNRRRKDKVTLPAPQRVAEAGFNDQTAIVEVRNPFQDAYGKGDERIAVRQQLRGDPLAQLLNDGYIDEAQYQAGRRWQGDSERAEIGKVRSIDFERPVVDYGAFAPVDVERVFTERMRGNNEPLLSRARQRASSSLAVDDENLGPEGASLVRFVLGLGLSIEAVAVAAGRDPDPYGDDVRGLRQDFRDCLNVLALRRPLAVARDYVPLPQEPNSDKRFF